MTLPAPPGFVLVWEGARGGWSAIKRSLTLEAIKLSMQTNTPILYNRNVALQSSLSREILLVLTKVHDSAGYNPITWT